jgi:glycosyltransferase involved in cell wall biosynthesis
MAKFKYLRFVSKRQANNFRFRQTKHIDVIPVALSKVEFGQTPRKVNGEFVLGFLGRLHKDRGTETLIKIFQNLLPNHPEVRLIIAGDGPEEKRISSELVDRYPMQVTLLGQVSERIKEVFWTEIDVLISLAPFESYGLAIRESVLYSRPVLAFPTSGTIDLLDSVGKSWVALIGRLDSDTDILIKAQNIASLQNRSDLPKVFTEPPDAVKLIVGSWTKIIG